MLPNRGSMANKKTQQENVDNVNIPMTLTLRGMVFIIAAVASMVTAWGLFGTRLSVVEEKIIYISNSMVEIRNIVKDIKNDDRRTNAHLVEEMDKLDERLRMVENSQTQIKTMLTAKKK